MAFHLARGRRRLPPHHARGTGRADGAAARAPGRRPLGRRPAGAGRRPPVPGRGLPSGHRASRRPRSRTIWRARRSPRRSSSGRSTKLRPSPARPGGHVGDGLAVAADDRPLAARHRLGADQAVEDVAGHRDRRGRSAAARRRRAERPAPSSAVRYHVSFGSPSMSCAIVNRWPRVQDGWTAYASVRYTSSGSSCAPARAASARVAVHRPADAAPSPPFAPADAGAAEEAPDAMLDARQQLGEHDRAAARWNSATLRGRVPPSPAPTSSHRVTEPRTCRACRSSGRRRVAP